ncbi:MAG: hypothetical protein JXB32_24855 [Deltaproteobacteria bacterium]|nr:hypothetical protein [Deltaproteobacteria bacterium]
MLSWLPVVSGLLVVVSAAGLVALVIVELLEKRRLRKVVDKHVDAFCELRSLAIDLRLKDGNPTERELYRWIRNLSEGRPIDDPLEEDKDR